jgi:hypothetical protein
MSELVQNKHRASIRLQLLTTASALALAGAAFSSARADNIANKPPVWIELGGEFEQIADSQESFDPPFSSLEFATGPLKSGVAQIPRGDVQHPLKASFGAEGKALFEPQGTDWVFSAGIRYGQSSGAKHLHGSSQPQPYHFFSISLRRDSPEFSDATAKKSEKHAIIDFQAGKDVGLGLFGSSVMNVGIRMAQFHTDLSTSLDRDPNNGGYEYFFGHNLPSQNARDFQMVAKAVRNFHGIGPSLSWEGTTPIAKNAENAQFVFDWGINAAILFGRQRANVSHKTYEVSHPPPSKGNPSNLALPVYSHPTPVPTRSRTVAVPNIGGMAGVSLRFPNAKISLGYRADFFFGAMDGGIGTAHKENIGFYGPFASVSIGLGG